MGQVQAASQTVALYSERYLGLKPVQHEFNHSIKVTSLSESGELARRHLVAKDAFNPLVSPLDLQEPILKSGTTIWWCESQWEGVFHGGGRSQQNEELLRHP